jgi:hypothetical protein
MMNEKRMAAASLQDFCDSGESNVEAAKFVRFGSFA